MFESIALAPPDPILGLNDAFGKDPRADKINLGVGVFKDAEGKTPTLRCVREAEHRLLEEDAPKTYLPIPGAPAYGAHVQRLLFGEGSAVLDDGRAVTAQSPGGTGALRVLADFLAVHGGRPRVWLSDPTWANHGQIMKAAGLEVTTYPWYDPATHGLAFDRLVDALKQTTPRDAVLLHGCCHNPSGVDPTPEQWEVIAGLAEERGFLPFLDFAYQGFGQGLDEDAQAVRAIAARVPELVVASSFSKNFGLYNERVGALTFVGKDRDQAARAFSQLKVTIRSNYSNPSRHGGAIVTRILDDEDLTQCWHEEVAGMRSRIHEMRSAFVKGLAEAGAQQDFSFIERQRGMFSFSGLTRAQVDRLRDEHGVYVVGSGRINVAGMTPGNLPRLCQAIAAVL